MRLRRSQVQKVAALARLELTAEELERLTGELSDILALVDKLGELDIAQLLPPEAELERCPLRADQVQPSLPRATLLAAAPHHDEAFFLVPKGSPGSNQSK